MTTQMIKTWQERYNSGGGSHEYTMQAEITELRAALAERDAELDIAKRGNELAMRMLAARQTEIGDLRTAALKEKP